MNAQAPPAGLHGAGAETRRRSPTRRWLVATFAALLATGISHALQSVLHDAMTFVFAYPAIVLISLRQGFGPAMLTALVYGAGVLLQAPGSAAPLTELPARFGLYGVASIVIALACAQSGEIRRRLATPGVSNPDSVDTPLTRWLQAVIWGAALIPLTLFAAACWWGYESALASAQERVTRANLLTQRHAERTFGTAVDVARQARALVSQPDAQLRNRDAEIRQRLGDMLLGMPAVQAIMVWDASGRLVLGTAQSSPAAATSIADRPYFQQARTADDKVFFSDLIRGRLSGQHVLNAVARRSAPDGSFAGVVAVSLYPTFFQEFYQSLASEEPGLNSFALFRVDGSVLARWPAPPEGMRLPDDSRLARAARAGEAMGVVRLRSGFDGQRRMISFMRVEGTPVYTSAALMESAILEPWHRLIVLLAAVLGPVTIGLVYVSWVALKKTRREQIVLLELQAEMKRRAQTEKALAQAQRLEALSVLTGGVAHDFNNLLAIVNGNIHLIRRHHPDVGNGRHLIAISRAVASGVRLTRQLLSFARRQALKPEQIVLQSWLPGMADLLQSTVGHNVELVITVAADVPPIHVDVGELELALINLATNAKDAMDDQGTLRLEAARSSAFGCDGGGVVIRVSDTGGGIAPALLAKVFEPFFTTKPPSKGTGLGLSQVHGFCRQAGGDASVESAAGHGTTVLLSFPADVPAPASADESGARRPAVRLTGRVLLVEDNPEVAATHRELLESTGIAVDHAATGEEALRLLDAAGARHDLVLSDIAMPGGLDGIQLAVRLQASRPELPVLLLTGHAARLEDAQRLGCRVLGKPVDPELLIAEVGQAFRVEAVAG